jgi:hypothetical protein
MGKPNREDKRLIEEKYRATDKAKRVKKAYFSTLIARYKRLVLQCKYRGLGAIGISFEEWKDLVCLPCFYCGGSLPYSGGGLDRINSNIGYVKGNIRPCCTDCNKAKNSMTESEFKEWALRLYNHWARG